MKKILYIVLCTVFLVVVSAGCLTLRGSADEITVKVNGETLTFDENPINEGGRVMVPMRKIFEAMGCDVDWNEETGTITAVTKDESTIELTIDSNTMKGKNGKEIILDAAPTVRGGRTLVPVRAISESIGASVLWDEETRTVNVSYNTEISAEFEEEDFYNDYSSQASDIDLSAGQPQEITSSGIYRVFGILQNGTLTVNIDKSSDKGTVFLILDSADITSSTSAPIYVKEAKKVVILLQSGTQNTISSGFAANDDGMPDAAIFSESDLTIAGDGTLIVNASAADGIASRDDLKITGGTINVTAGAHGIEGKDMLAVKSGDITVNASGDGMRSVNTDADKGNIVIYGGSFDITATNDGIQAENTLCVYDGDFNITVGGGFTQAKEHMGDKMFGGMQGGRMMQGADGEMPQRHRDGEMAGQMQPPADMYKQPQTENADETETSEESIKGIKAGSFIDIKNGRLNINSADDTVHSNRDIHISGGTLLLSAGGDAVHADSSLYVTGGSITADTSYEGLEGAYITIGGGNINITASDDGVNVNDKNGLLTIADGYVLINADGDGLDSNGDIDVCGGSIYVDGPISGGNGALDTDGEFTVSSATMIATGSAGMAMAPSSNSAQPSVLLYFNSVIEAGTTVDIKDSAGNEIASFTPSKQFQTAVISAPQLIRGESYTITTGEKSVTYTQSDMSVRIDENGSLQSNGGMGGGMRGGMGGQRMPRGNAAQDIQTQENKS